MSVGSSLVLYCYLLPIIFHTDDYDPAFVPSPRCVHNKPVSCQVGRALEREHQASCRRGGRRRGRRRALPAWSRPLSDALSVPAVVDHYTSTIVFNGVRIIAIVIIGLGFLLLLLPEEWDVWLVKLLTRLKVRKKEETAEGGAADQGLGPPSKRRGRPSFAR